MKRNLSTLIFAILATLVFNTSAMAADEAEYQAALANARQALADAQQQVQLWTTSEVLLEEAAEAAASGNFDLAVEQVNEAVLHAELALATAEREKKVWQKGVPK